MADGPSQFVWSVLRFEDETLTHFETYSTESSAKTAATDLLVKNAPQTTKKSAKSPQPVKDSEGKFESVDSFTLTLPDHKNDFRVQILKTNLKSEDSTMAASTEGKAKGKRKAKETSKDAKAGKGAAKDSADPDLDDEEAPPKKVAMRKKPGVIDDGQEGCLNGIKLIFTGTFDSMDRKGCTETAEKYGATIVKKLEDADYVVLGVKPGPKKVDEIREKELTTMSEEEFLNVLKGGELP